MSSTAHANRIDAIDVVRGIALFGVGLAIQFEQLSARGRPFYWLVRRLLVLLGFGLLHLLLVWNGDILTEYALVGLLALPFLRLRTVVLALAACGFLLLYVVQPWAIQWPSTALGCSSGASACFRIPPGSGVRSGSRLRLVFSGRWQ